MAWLDAASGIEAIGAAWLNRGGGRLIKFARNLIIVNCKWLLTFRASGSVKDDPVLG